MLRGLFLSALLSTSALADGVSVPGLPPFAGSHAAVRFPPSSGGGENVVFTPTQLYYMAASGSSDSYDGKEATHTTGTTGPWASPNHAVNCGDVIIAAAGTYSSGQFGDKFGAVSGCPSTSGGIDGTGGIYFATVLCAGPDLMSCNITTAGGSGGPPSLVEWSDNQSNWAIEGFNLNSTPTLRGFGVMECNPAACSTTPYFSHHIAVINNIVSDSRNGFGANDGGDGGGSASFGLDYTAVVGNIGQNANQEGTYDTGICDSAFDFVSLGKYDTNAGTHAYMYGNFAMANLVPDCSAYYDGEAYMIDSPTQHLFNGTAVLANNIGYDSTRACIQLTDQGTSSSNVTVKMYNNTCYYNNLQGASGVDYTLGELNTGSGAGGTRPWTMSFFNNLMVPPAASENSVPLYSAVIGGATWTSWKEGTAVAAGDQNVVVGMETTCISGSCAPSTSPYAETYFNSNPAATNTQNTYENAAFTNTTDLLANRVGVPNCTGFTNTTACMGWNANTSTLTTPSVISDLVPTASGTAGKGYQNPSTTCAANADYPTWLKGIVYLQWNGSSLTENADLVTKPCGL